MTPEPVTKFTPPLLIWRIVNTSPAAKGTLAFGGNVTFIAVDALAAINMPASSKTSVYEPVMFLTPLNPRAAVVSVLTDAESALADVINVETDEFKEFTDAEIALAETLKMPTFAIVVSSDELTKLIEEDAELADDTNSETVEFSASTDELIALAETLNTVTLAFVVSRDELIERIDEFCALTDAEIALADTLKAKNDELTALPDVLSVTSASETVVPGIPLTLEMSSLVLPLPTPPPPEL